MPWFTPTDSLSAPDLEKGLKVLYWESLSSHSMILLVTGAFLPGMALALGASNFTIGVLASFAPIAQMAQIPAILIIEKFPFRKLLTVLFGLISRFSLVAAALVPFFAPESSRVLLFTLLMILFFIAGAFAACSRASLIKDIVPEKRRGTILATRLAAATALGAGLSLAAGFSIDSLTVLTGESSRAFAIVFLVAAGFGLLGTLMTTRLPETIMPKATDQGKWIKKLITPIKEPNFRRLLIFSFSWAFTVVMAGAFFTVYMLNRIGIPMSWVIMLAVLSQATNIYFFRLWGKIADRYSNKSVLAVSVPMFIFLLLLYPFTTLPERYYLTIPILILIHIIGGISTAGFNLCSANIAMRLAPHGHATAYLGTNAFCSGLAAAIAPIVGGLLASFFDIKELSIALFYRPDASDVLAAVTIPALSIRGIDFVFFAAAITGLYAWHRLSLIDEEGTVSEAEVRDQVFASVRNSFGSASGLSMGVRQMTNFPYQMLRRTSKSYRDSHPPKK